MEEIKCPECGASEYYKSGIRKFAKPPYEKQQYKCKNCGRLFYLREEKPKTGIDPDKPSTWRQRTFRSPPDLDEFIDQDSVPFQYRVEAFFRKLYKKEKK